MCIRDRVCSALRSAPRRPSGNSPPRGALSGLALGAALAQSLLSCLQFDHALAAPEPERNPWALDRAAAVLGIESGNASVGRATEVLGVDQDAAVGPTLDVQDKAANRRIGNHREGVSHARTLD